MKLRKLFLTGSLTLFLGAAVSASADTANYVETRKISGWIQCIYAAKRNVDPSGKVLAGKSGVSSLFANDSYHWSIRAGLFWLNGHITRSPRVLTRSGKFEYRAPKLRYDLAMRERHPSIESFAPAGRVEGVLRPREGAWRIDDSEEGLLMIEDGDLRRTVSVNEFKGAVRVELGNAEERAFRRTSNGETVEYHASGLDSLVFEDFVLAGGPASRFPSAVVRGRVLFERSTGHWFFDDLHLRYSESGKTRDDVLSGSLQRSGSPESGTLRVRLQLNSPEPFSRPGSAASPQTAKPDLFFGAESDVPRIQGTISSRTERGTETAIESRMVDYNLETTKLSEIQLMGFAKLLTVLVGVTDDWAELKLK